MRLLRPRDGTLGRTRCTSRCRCVQAVLRIERIMANIEPSSASRGVPQAGQFVERSVAIAELERFSCRGWDRSGAKDTRTAWAHGIGKTQLAVEFARRHHRRFSLMFWLDGQSRGTLRSSIASFPSRIPPGHILETSRLYASDSGANTDAVVEAVMAWLAQPDNTAWLLIFDNVYQEYRAHGGDPDAYLVKRYLSGADHGSVLLTTRLGRLEHLGDSQQLGKVSKDQGQAIFESWYKKKYDTAESKRLHALLDGLPFAIARRARICRRAEYGWRRT
ncbi:hypothetical protein T440DRAFT_126030 [Plenodomus tracheiphilus IPT5]|uniref:NB-ARC domain-containing protein n=1 Tax=Plenodomus tracheiphilus IPT5 TaxID=1408161 RepID=A0A6A7B544_9PLEO|nr:hypothetical protein T440DRAFT_126030 [Plenodomus tracheiphilus IPT5]